MSDAASLVCQGISLRRAGRELLSEVSLSAAPGEALSVLGPSGAGKSTLFRALAGELSASGTVTLLGQDVSSWPLWRRARLGLGYLPQTPSVLGSLTVESNLMTFAKLTGREPRVKDRAREVHLEDRLTVRAGQLSGGERRRLELARVLVTEPSVLLCDEPFSGVDPQSAELLAAVLRSRVEAGATLLLSDHRVREALRLSRRALLLVDGRVELTVPAAAFAEHPLVRERYLG
ncbi:MAG: ATP-binding cassette domain-containing protein [Polyangiaceae bacterium]|nr:ATP-binding cassette domain-containing protein [Polyangiaceae bacterium]MCW5791208.1 ATP-binding cassette domain-containing protein [Polyangiaceae bacterium]